jgi:uncharacterized membrane protein
LLIVDRPLGVAALNPVSKSIAERGFCQEAKQTRRHAHALLMSERKDPSTAYNRCRNLDRARMETVANFFEFGSGISRVKLLLIASFSAKGQVLDIQSLAKPAGSH